ncbi:hypothetical protein BHM03_00007755 [Ensete ventricosum]|nr:hypothetical protein BHM03_00007755 [Ensete ventricosum]
MFKIIKEMLPPDVRVARDTQDLLVECCVGGGGCDSGLALRAKRDHPASDEGKRIPAEVQPRSTTAQPCCSQEKPECNHRINSWRALPF